jgi:hypothetical protein
MPVGRSETRGGSAETMLQEQLQDLRSLVVHASSSLGNARPRREGLRRTRLPLLGGLAQMERVRRELSHSSRLSTRRAGLRPNRGELSGLAPW